MNGLTAKITIDLDRKAHLSFLLIEEIIILIKYSDFKNIFLKESVEVLRK